MSIVDISLDLENVPDQALQQLGQGGDARYPQYLVLAEVQRRKDMRDRFQAQQAKQQAANPPSIAEQRMAEMSGGIPSADPNMQGADPSLQTGIAGPPQGGPPPMAGGGLIPGYDSGGGIPAHEHDPRTGRHIDPDTGEILREESALSGMNLSGLGDFPDQEQNLISRMIQATPATLGAMGSTDVYDIETGDVRPMSERREEWQERWRREKEEQGLGPITESTTLDTTQALMDYAAEGGNASEEINAMREEAGLPPLEEGQGAEIGPPEEDVYDAQDILDRYAIGGAGGMGTLQDVYGEAQGRIDEYTELLRTMSPEDEEYNRIRRELAEAKHEQAQRLRDMGAGRQEEMESILADRLGLSEERVREMQGEMDTPDEIRNRRKASVFSALGATLMGSPTGLGAGLERTTDKLAATDDVLRGERDTALREIFGEREKGLERKATGRTGIYDQMKADQQDWDTANNALANFDVTLAKETADKGRAGAEQALDAHMKLAESQARQIGAWNSTMASIQAQVKSASLDRENFLADPKNWEAIANQIDDMRSRISRISDTALREKQLEMVNNLEQFYVGAVGLSGQSMAEAIFNRDPRASPVTDMTEEIPTHVIQTGMSGRAGTGERLARQS
tara:strand:- start:137 stop:2014 length:1878 start_codon:yes stop_codon:yes gene_type:complete